MPENFSSHCLSIRWSVNSKARDSRASDFQIFGDGGLFGVAACTREFDLQNLTRVPRFWRINRPPKIKNFHREFLGLELIDHQKSEIQTRIPRF